jgi:hypothetical protein
MNSGSKVIYNQFTVTERYDATPFREFAEFAKDFGATHVTAYLFWTI